MEKAVTEIIKLHLILEIEKHFSSYNKVSSIPQSKIPLAKVEEPASKIQIENVAPNSPITLEHCFMMCLYLIIVLWRCITLFVIYRGYPLHYLCMILIKNWRDGVIKMKNLLCHQKKKALGKFFVHQNLVMFQICIPSYHFLSPQLEGVEQIKSASSIVSLDT